VTPVPLATRRPLPVVLVPSLTMLGAILLDLLPLPSAAPRAAAPSLLIATWYFWTVHRPELLPPLALFGLGCLLDAGGGMPVGITPLALLLGRALILSGQRWLHRQVGPVVWACFLPVAVVIAGMRWGLASMARGGPLPLAPVMVEAALTFLAYPVVAGLLGRVGARSPWTGRATAGG
jgi:rod shape-determining protein MreD